MRADEMNYINGEGPKPADWDERHGSQQNELRGTVLGQEPHPHHGLAPISQKLDALAHNVHELEEAYDELQSIRATLQLNFGRTAQNKYGFIVRHDESTLRLLLRVLQGLSRHCPDYLPATKYEGKSGPGFYPSGVDCDPPKYQGKDKGADDDVIIPAGD